MTDLISPHGGKLVDLLADDERRAQLRELAQRLPDLALDAIQTCDLELLLQLGPPVARFHQK